MQAVTPLSVVHSLAVTFTGTVQLYGGYLPATVDVEGHLKLLGRNVGAAFGEGRAVIASESLKIYDLERGKNTGGLAIGLPPRNACVLNADSLLLQVGATLYRVDARVKDGAASKINTGGRNVCGITQMTESLAAFAFLEKKGSTHLGNKHSNATGLAMIDVRSGAPRDSPCLQVEGLSLTEEVKFVDAMPVGDGKTLAAAASELGVGLVLLRNGKTVMQFKLQIPDLDLGIRVCGIYLHKTSGLDDDDEDEEDLSSCVITVHTNNNIAISYKMRTAKEGETMVELYYDKMQKDVICYGKNNTHLSHASVVRRSAPAELQDVWYGQTGEGSDEDEDSEFSDEES
jgi:hypothetical protein